MNVSLPLFLLLNLLFSSSHAFVLNRPSSLHVVARSNAATPTTARSGLRQQSKKLLQMSFDPNTIFDSMISTTGSIMLSEELGSAVGDGEGAISYSRASYYTILALYLISLPGLWSTIQRTTKVKIQKKTYLSPGAQSSDGRSLRQEAAEIMACKFVVRNQTLPQRDSPCGDKTTPLLTFYGIRSADMKANNYMVKDAGETITFEGIVQRSLSQAFFLAFVTALGMASLALVLQIQFNDLGAL